MCFYVYIRTRQATVTDRKNREFQQVMEENTTD